MRRPRLRVVVALAWLLAAAGVTVWLAPLLGLRGWAWLLLHHALCLLGAGSELWRDWRAWRGGRLWQGAPPLQGETR